ncbi:unnamed protein product [Musa acuminata var. zebrina]
MDVLLISSSSSVSATSRRLRMLGPSGLPPPTSSSFPPRSFLRISAVRIEEKPRAAEPKTKTAPTSTTTTTTPYQDNKQDSGISQRTNHRPIPPRLQPAPVSRVRAAPSPQAIFCNALDELINNFIDPPVLRPSVDPRHVLSNNFAPVDELPPTSCPVVRGAIPRCLAGGAYIRNGPNPQHLPRGPHHLFDGDGMLHSLLLPPAGSDGMAPAILCSRYVRTYRYLLERDAGALSSQHILRLPRSRWYGARRCFCRQGTDGADEPGRGWASRTLAWPFGGRLYALGESDLPYAVRVSSDDGDVATLGRCDFEGGSSWG